MYELLELHLAAVPLSRKHAAAVKKARGDKTSARGNRLTRYVTLPATERDLIDELVREYGGETKTGGTTIVARGGNTYGEPAWVAVQQVSPKGQLGASEQFAVLYASAREQAVKRGILPSDEQVAWDKAYAEATAENERRKREVYLEVMCEALTQYLESWAPDNTPDSLTRNETAREGEKRACAERYLKQYQEGRVL
jgi:hypothetical protein